ncbi:MAG: ribosomal-processing cysteine protease Prp [Eubacteriales bacterium]|nr:ribosomal-processing cysteine protease Prp [Eubacteriales bacterium]
MIDCAFSQGSDGLLRAFRFFGHADTERAGRDLLCAAASTLGQTTIAGFVELLEIVPRFELDPDLGLIQMDFAAEQYKRLSQRKREDANLLIANCLLGVKLLAESNAERIQWRVISHDEFQELVQ